MTKGGRILLTGRRFGQLLVIQEIEKRIGGKYRIVVLCDCGVVKAMDKAAFSRNVKPQSCGCGMLRRRNKFKDEQFRREEGK